MRRYESKILGISFVAMLILGMIPMFPVAASPTATIYLAPSDYKFNTDTVTAPCYKFNVSVMVRDVADLHMFSVTIKYDDTIINVTRWFEPTWNSSYVHYGRATLAVPAPPAFAFSHTDPNIGAATGGASLFPDPPSPLGFNGTGLLAIFEFHVSQIPGKGGLLSCTLDMQDSYMQNPGGDIPSTKENGYYELKWKEPTLKPYLAVDPTLQEFGPYPPTVVGQAFNVSVYLKDVAAAWGVTNVTFCLCFNTTVIDIIGGALNVTIGGLWAGPNSVLVVHPGVPDKLYVTVTNPTTTPSGNVLLANIRFTIMMQGSSPPRPIGDFDKSDLTFCEYEIWDHSFEMVRMNYTRPPVPGLVKVYCLLTLPLPYFEVSPKDTKLGPDPSIGVEFDVKVKIRDLHFAWYLIGYEFRLGYDDHLLQVVSITEGPFLTDPKWNQFGTIFVSHPWNPPLPAYGIPYPSAIVAGLLIPNFTEPLPDFTHLLPNKHPDTINNPTIDNTLAIIRFRAIKQLYPECLSCPLDLYYLYPPHAENWLLDKYGNSIIVDYKKNINGTYSINTTPLPGRMIDVYGGLDCTFYPAPYGGQGLNKPMDIVWPQKQVCLFANVTYNFWPVQQKVVSFEVEGPFDINLATDNMTAITKPVCTIWWLRWPYWDTAKKYHLSSWDDKDRSQTLTVGDVIDTKNLGTGDIEWWYVTEVWFDVYWYIEIRPIYYPSRGDNYFLYKGTAITDENGVAKISFRMPWPCDNPESWFGIYKVTATVDIACTVVTDVLYFHYDYLVRISSVTTQGGVQNKGLYFNHCQDVGITISYVTHSMQRFPLLISVFIKDELDVPIGYALVPLQAGGATWCKYKTGIVRVFIHVPKFAFAGTATIHVNCFNKDPTEGGFAYCPEFAPTPVIYIQPF